MPDDPSSNELLLIRCPSCGQRFNVEEEFRGRLVECGECDHQFEINDNTILRGKKFYPGERKDPLLSHVPKVDKPIPAVNDPGSGLSYEQQVGQTIEPVSPARALLGVAGVFLMVVTASFLIMGAAKGGVLDGVTTDKRLIMAGFASVLGFALLLYANPRSRVMASVTAVLLSAGLLSLPFVFDEGSELVVAGEDDFDYEIKEEYDPDRVREKMTTEELRELIGLEPLEKEIARLENEGSLQKAVGVWMRNTQIRNHRLIKEYLIHETGASEQTHYYPRGSDEILVVISGIDQTLEDIAIVASVFGKVESVYDELQVVEVTVDNSLFIPGPIDKLTDPKDPEFYLLNKVELESIDPSRVSTAVERLAAVEPVLFRTDITNRLVELLDNDWVEFKSDVCRALVVWADSTGTGAGKASLKWVKELVKMRQSVPEDAIALAVRQNTEGTIPVLVDLWLENPTIWEKWLIEAGKDVEPVVVRQFDTLSGGMRHSAVRVLGRVGGRDSLTLLEKQKLDEKEGETLALINTSINLIKVRLMAER